MMEHFKKALTYLHTRWQRTLYAIKFWLLRMIGSEKDIGGVRVILIRNGRVVLLRHWLSPDVWTLPGGGINKGESPTDAGIREVWEETGYKINSFGGRLGIYRGRMGEKDSVIVLYTEDFEGGLKWLPNLEVMERGLFDLNNLPENLSPANRRRLIAFKKGVRNQRGKW
jgi:8-oxo-dGTP pyrophosphatase MutT (NUDIX family)